MILAAAVAVPEVVKAVPVLMGLSFIGGVVVSWYFKDAVQKIIMGVEGFVKSLQAKIDALKPAPAPAPTPVPTPAPKPVPTPVPPVVPPKPPAG